MTPEGEVKAMVKQMLHQYGILNAAKAGTDEAKAAVGWYTMPTPNAPTDAYGGGERWSSKS